MSLSLKHSRDYHNLLNNVIENELTIHDKPNHEVLWVKMGNQLEIEGVAKNQISTIMRKDIEDRLYEKQFKEFMPREDYRWHNGSYWLVTKKNGWTNSDMARHTIDPTQDQLNSSINTKFPNQEMIDIFMDIKEICNLGIDKAKNTKEFEELFDKKETREFYKQQRAFISNCKDVLDEKTKIPVNTELLFIECVTTAEGGLNNAVKLFHKTRMQLLDDQGKKLITAKQSAKYLNGDKASKLPLLKPNSRDSAIFEKYFGVQCECGSWRVRPKNDGNKVECFDCSLEFIAKTLSKCTYCQTPLYKESLLHIMKTNRCENCNTEIILPQEIIDQINT